MKDYDTNFIYTFYAMLDLEKHKMNIMKKNVKQKCLEKNGDMEI